jgi:hypothetical protein
MDTRQYFRARGVARRLSPKLLSSVNSVALVVVVFVVFVVFVVVVVVLVVDGVVGARARKKRTLRAIQKSFDANSIRCFPLRACVSGANQQILPHRLVGRISRGGSPCIPGSASARASLLIIPLYVLVHVGVQAVLFECSRAFIGRTD